MNFATNLFPPLVSIGFHQFLVINFVNHLKICSNPIFMMEYFILPFFIYLHQLLFPDLYLITNHYLLCFPSLFFIEFLLYFLHFNPSYFLNFHQSYLFDVKRINCNQFQHIQIWCIRLLSYPQVQFTFSYSFLYLCLN